MKLRYTAALLGLSVLVGGCSARGEVIAKSVASSLPSQADSVVAEATAEAFAAGKMAVDAATLKQVLAERYGARGPMTNQLELSASFDDASGVGTIYAQISGTVCQITLELTDTTVQTSEPTCSTQSNE